MYCIDRGFPPRNRVFTLTSFITSGTYFVTACPALEIPAVEGTEVELRETAKANETTKQRPSISEEALPVVDALMLPPGPLEKTDVQHIFYIVSSSEKNRPRHLTMGSTPPGLSGLIRG